MIGTWNRIRATASAAGWLALLAPLALILFSIFRTPETNWTVKAAVAAFCALAIVRPAAALLVSIALVGFSSILANLAGVPLLRTSEVLIVATLAGAFARAAAPGTSWRRALTESISVPVVLFATVVYASAFVWQRVQQFETGYASDYWVALTQFVSRDYFVRPGDFFTLLPVAALLECLALYVVVAAACRVDHTFFQRALHMLVLGGSGLAIMSGVRLAEIHLRNPGAITELRAAGALRISPQIPDVIAAGSYFALCWVIATGLAIQTSTRRWLWIASGVPLLAALYLTGSRSVIAAALVGLVVLLVMALRDRRWAAIRLWPYAAAIVVAMVVSYPFLTGRDVAGELARQSLVIRAELFKTGLRVIATHPVFGVGIDRFYLVATGLASPELNLLWPGRKNPHNDLLRIGGELGLVGAGLFVWILGAAFGRAVTALRAERDIRLAALGAGLIAFLVTTLGSNPLVIREVSYVFWAGLALLAGHAATHSGTAASLAPTASLAPGSWAARLKWPAALLGVTAIITTIPFRANQELSALTFREMSYGLFHPGQEPDGTLSRWSGPRAAIFVTAGAKAVEIPLSSTLPGGARQDVEIRVDGRLANRVAVGPAWDRVRVLIPRGSSTQPRRIDLAISPTWVPADVLPGSDDRRVLGVKVGEIKVIGPER